MSEPKGQPFYISEKLLKKVLKTVVKQLTCQPYLQLFELDLACHQEKQTPNLAFQKKGSQFHYTNTLRKWWGWSKLHIETFLQQTKPI